MNLVIHTDGGARGNPGPAAIGVVIEESGKVIASFGKRIGETTNNVAEYTAVIEALRYLVDGGQGTGDRKIVDFYLDSTLVVNQLNGLFKIKQPHLRGLFLQVRKLEHRVGAVVLYRAIPREQNSHADALVNQAFDR